MTDIVKQSEFKPLSISNRLGKSSLQVTIIVELIKKCINENRVLLKEDIINSYVEWQDTGRTYRKFMTCAYDKSTGKYGRIILTKDEFHNHWTTETKAKQWFRSNLGSAIIQGKLLVIPIIEI